MFPKVTVMSSPNQSTAAPNSGRSQGIFDVALSHDKDPMKILEEQLSEDSSELSKALWNTLRHICTAMNGKSICESAEIEIADGLLFGLLSGTFFRTHCLSLFVVDPDNFTRQMSLILTNRVVGDDLFKDLLFPLGPKFDLVTEIRKAATSVQTSFFLFHLSDTDSITRVETHFCASPMHLAMLAIHGSQIFDVQVCVTYHHIFSPIYQYRPQDFTRDRASIASQSTHQQSLKPASPPQSSANSSNSNIGAAPKPAAPLPRDESSSAIAAPTEDGKSTKAASEEDEDDDLGNPILKPVSQKAVVDDADNKCVHCNSSLFQGKTVRLFRCVGDSCANYFHHVCNGKDGHEDVGSSRCSFCIKKIKPVFEKDLGGECEGKDSSEVVDLEQEDAELQKALVKFLNDVCTSLTQFVGGLTNRFHQKSEAC